MKPPKALPITAADKQESARKERLRLALPVAVELLRSRQAGLISATEIEEFVAMNWLEWHGGTLKLTVTGANVCSQGKASSAQSRG